MPSEQMTTKEADQRATTLGAPLPVSRLRPVTDDLEFLFQLYASTRAGEKELVGWGDQQWHLFVRMQFDLQHGQYMRNYRNANFHLVLLDGKPVGRLYLDRCEQEIRVIDISILSEYRGQGLGRELLEVLNHEADEAGLHVTLHVEKHNPALRLYQRLGFTVETDCGVRWFMVRPCGSG